MASHVAPPLAAHRWLVLAARLPGQCADQAPAAPRHHRLGRACARRRAGPQGAIWVGTYGQGIYRLPAGAETWESIRARHDRQVDLLGLRPGPRVRLSGEIWYGTVGNGWGLSTDGGATWRNWTFEATGSRVAVRGPVGIVVRGDTTVIATADGLQLTTDDGAHWMAVGDAVGPRRKGSGRHRVRAAGQRVRPPAGADRRGWHVSTLRGNQRLVTPRRAGKSALAAAALQPANAVLIGRQQIRGTPLRTPPGHRTCPASASPAPAAGAPRAAHHLVPPADRATDNAYIDQTYRYGSTMGGNFQQHQGVEFNNPDGTPVHAIAVGNGGLCRPRGSGRAHGGHPARYHHHGRRQDAAGSFGLLPQLRARGAGGRRVTRGPADLPRGQYRPRHQRPPASRGARLADRLGRRRSWTRCSGSRPTPPIPSCGSSRCRAPASSRARCSTPRAAGAAGPDLRHRQAGSQPKRRSPTPRPTATGPSAPALRRALRGGRCARRGVRRWAWRSAGRRYCGG